MQVDGRLEPGAVAEQICGVSILLRQVVDKLRVHLNICMLPLPVIFWNPCQDLPTCDPFPHSQIHNIDIKAHLLLDDFYYLRHTVTG